MNKQSGAGKGDRARNNASRKFKNNYAGIQWGKKLNPLQRLVAFIKNLFNRSK